MTDEHQPTPEDVLTTTREVFAATHWIAGTMIQNGEKIGMCALGGLRVTAELLAQNVVGIAEMIDQFDPYDWEGYEKLSVAAAVAPDSELYEEAVRDLAMTVAPVRYGEMLANDEVPRIEQCEDFIVSWNDQHYAVAGILDAFDKAIESRRKRNADQQS